MPRKPRPAQDYFEKLKDPRWQQLRLRILDRDAWTCRFCGATDRTLHVHHGHYIWGKDPWDYDPLSLITLCEDCHFWESDCRKDAITELQKALTRVPSEEIMRFALLLQEHPDPQKVLQRGHD